MTREDFMAFFRLNLDLLTPDDRIEIFSTIMLGADDFTYDLLDGIFKDYSVEHLDVVPVFN